MSVIGSNILAGASGQGGGYNLTKSLRFRSSASAYLNRTPASSGNKQIWTYSTWLKRGSLGQAFLLSGESGSNNDQYQYIYIQSNDAIQFIIGQIGSNPHLTSSSAVFRDPSAWYHVVSTFDSTQSTAANRWRLYINGVEQTMTGTVMSQNYNSGWINGNNRQGIMGRLNYSTSTGDGYLAETNFIDGQALTPSSFGETSTSTGVWIPKKYTGSYGTNGFYLPFTDTTSTSTLGTDFSGNSNTWTVNNISLTSGSTYDSMNDVPTLTSATASNFATLNPLQLGSGVSTSNANLSGTNNANSRGLTSTIHASSGKFYWEVNPTSGTNQTIGVVDSTFPPNIDIFSSGYNTCGYYVSGDIYVNGSVSTTVASYSTSDTIGVALNVDTNQVTFYKNNTSQATITLTSGITWKAFLGNGSGAQAQSYNINFGQRPFAYTPPTDFKALNTFNLPTPAIGATASTQAGKYFNPVLYTGNGGSQSVTGVGFQPDWVWVKVRSSTQNHSSNDSVRGAGNYLVQNATAAERFQGEFDSFDSDGFSLTFDAGEGDYNGSGKTYVAWNWRANQGTNVSNTQGSITSTVSANTTAGFSIVTYTGSGSAATVGHGLGVAPSMIIVKDRDNGTYDWNVYHANLSSPTTLKLYLNTSDAENNGGTNSGTWNSTAPTSTVFSLGTFLNVNKSGDKFVAYCFAPVAGYSAMGSYVGNGSTDGTFVYLGFRPRYILIKKSSGTEDWAIFDSSRSSYNIQGGDLYADLSIAEGTSQGMDFLSNGVKMRNSGGSWNASGSTYIYYAVAENPFKYSLSR